MGIKATSRLIMTGVHLRPDIGTAGQGRRPGSFGIPKYIFLEATLWTFLLAFIAPAPFVTAYGNSGDSRLL